ncbi:hypothetical protein Tco_0551778 [Tanacetum coccineum]
MISSTSCIPVLLYKAQFEITHLDLVQFVPPLELDAFNSGVFNSYGRNLIIPLDLVPVPEVGRFSEEGADQSEQIKELHRFVAYKGDSDDEPDSRSSLFHEGEDDADAVNERVNVANTLGAYFAATNFYGGLG